MAGSIRWWAKSPSRRSPQSCVDARGRHPARADLERMRDGAGERMAHADLPRRSTRAGHTQVAAAVDGAAPVTLERRRDEVGRPPLRRTAQVELEARRPADHARRDRRPPPRASARPGRHGPGDGAARRSDASASAAGGDVRARLGVAGTTHGTPSTVGSTRPPLRRAARSAALDRRAQQRRGGHARPRIRVQPREVAAGVEARQPPLDLGEHRPPRRHRRRRRARPAPWCPSSGSCRRAHASCRAGCLACRRSSRRRLHIGAVGLLQVRDLPGTGLGRQRGGGGGGGTRRAERRRRSSSPTPADRRGRDKSVASVGAVAMAAVMSRARGAETGGKLRTGLGSSHGYRPVRPARRLCLSQRFVRDRGRHVEHRWETMR